MARRKNPEITWLLYLVGGGAAYYFLIHKNKKRKAAVKALSARAEAAARGEKYYAAEDPSGVAMCFVTKTGAKAPMSSCFQEGAPGLLQGFGALGAHTLSSRGYGSLGAVDHTLSSKGYGSLS